MPLDQYSQLLKDELNMVDKGVVFDILAIYLKYSSVTCVRWTTSVTAFIVSTSVLVLRTRHIAFLAVHRRVSVRFEYRYRYIWACGE
jgi:hypothetical protein